VRVAFKAGGVVALWVVAVALATLGCSMEIPLFNLPGQGGTKLPRAAGPLPSLGIHNFSLDGAKVQGTTIITSIALLPNTLQFAESEDLEWCLADILAGYARSSQRFSRVLRNPLPRQRCDVTVRCRAVCLRLSKDPFLNALAILQPFTFFIPAQALTGTVEFDVEAAAGASPPQRTRVTRQVTNHLWITATKFGPTNFVHPVSVALMQASEDILLEAIKAHEGRR